MRRHEPQRTVADAPAAADAGRRLRQDGIRFRHGEDCIRVFQDRLVEIRHGDAHHRAAVEHLLRLRAEAAGLLKHICKLHPNGNDHILGLRDGGTVDRDALFDQRHTGPAVAGDVGKRRAVEHDRAHVQRELALGDDLADGIVDQHLFAALRVQRLERTDLHAVLVLRQLPVQLDAAGLVVLNGENHAAYLQKVLHETRALHQLLRPVEHRARVRGDIRLALRAVDDHGLDLLQILNGQLDDRREACAAEADHAAFAHGVQKILHGVELGRF